MDNWNESFDGVNIEICDKIIRVDDGERLKEKMQKNFSFAIDLSAYILKKYEETYGKELQISLKSLAIEIYAHFWVQEFFFKMQDIFGKRALFDKFILHTSVIDCGEKTVDNNRWIWDFISIFYLKKINEIKKVGAE